MMSNTPAGSSRWRAPTIPIPATTSFFLMLGDAPHLDGKYSAFGRIVGGMDVLDAFEKEDLNGESPRRRLEIVEVTIDLVMK